VVYGEDCPEMPFHCYHGNLWKDAHKLRNIGVWKGVEIGVVIDRGFRMCYFGLIYSPAFTVSLVSNECE
jgi:hypothetical protein